MEKYDNSLTYAYMSNDRKAKLYESYSDTLMPAHQSNNQTGCNHNNSTITLLNRLCMFFENGRTSTYRMAWKYKVDNIMSWAKGIDIQKWTM